MAEHLSIEEQICCVEAALNHLSSRPKFRGQEELLADIRAQLAVLRRLQQGAEAAFQEEEETAHVLRPGFQGSF
ncbi:MAG: hypothetical protein H5T69_17245 [Chloroflexi bacterium]|nr:hypothetical protein [Chloroflexota bacterium]